MTTPVSASTGRSRHRCSRRETSGSGPSKRSGPPSPASPRCADRRLAASGGEELGLELLDAVPRLASRLPGLLELLLLGVGPRFEVLRLRPEERALPQDAVEHALD